MTKKRWIRFGIASSLALTAVGLSSSETVAQRDDADLTASLLDGADCVVSASNYNYDKLYTDVMPVAINYQVFDRIFAIQAEDYGGNTSLSCRANPQKFSLIDLQMGVDDDSAEHESRMTINVYQGGILKHTYSNVQAGTMINVVLDLNDSAIPRNANSFAVQIFDCNSISNSCALQFVEARLHPDVTLTYIPENETSGIESSVNSVPPNPATPVLTTTPSQGVPSSQSSSTREDASPSEANSSREDPSPVNGVLSNVFDRFLDAIFK